MKKQRMKNRAMRPVTVLMMSSHQHIEMVEVHAVVRGIDYSDGRYEAELDKIAEAAIERMRAKADHYGPWNDKVETFEMVAAMAAVVGGIHRGRVTPLEDVKRAEVAMWGAHAQEAVRGQDQG